MKDFPFPERRQWLVTHGRSEAMCRAQLRLHRARFWQGSGSGSQGVSKVRVLQFSSSSRVFDDVDS